MSGEEGVVEGEGLTAVDGLSAANGLLRENLAAVDAGLAGASLKRKFEESFRDQLATQHLPPQSRPKVGAAGSLITDLDSILDTYPEHQQQQLSPHLTAMHHASPLDARLIGHNYMQNQIDSRLDRPTGLNSMHNSNTVDSRLMGHNSSPMDARLAALNYMHYNSSQMDARQFGHNSGTLDPRLAALNYMQNHSNAMDARLIGHNTNPIDARIAALNSMHNNTNPLDTNHGGHNSSALDARIAAFNSVHHSNPLYARHIGHNLSFPLPADSNQIEEKHTPANSFHNSNPMDSSSFGHNSNSKNELPNNLSHVLKNSIPMDEKNHERNSINDSNQIDANLGFNSNQKKDSSINTNSNLAEEHNHITNHMEACDDHIATSENNVESPDHESNSNETNKKPKGQKSSNLVGEIEKEVKNDTSLHSVQKSDPEQELCNDSTINNNSDPEDASLVGHEMDDEDDIEQDIDDDDDDQEDDAGDVGNADDDEDDDVSKFLSVEMSGPKIAGDSDVIEDANKVVNSDDLNEMCLYSCDNCQQILTRHEIPYHHKKNHPGLVLKSTIVKETYHRCKLCHCDTLFNIDNISTHLRYCHDELSWKEYRSKYLRNSEDGSITNENFQDYSPECGNESNIIVTDDVNKMCVYSCNICSLTMKSNVLHNHFKRNHPKISVQATIYRQNFHRCKICLCLMSFNIRTVSSHLRKYHEGINFKLYKANYLMGIQKMPYYDQATGPGEGVVKKEEYDEAKHFSCELCGVCYLTLDYLETHLRAMHGILTGSEYRTILLEVSQKKEIKEEIGVEVSEANKVHTSDLKEMSTVKCNFCGMELLLTRNMLFGHFRRKHPNVAPQYTPHRTTFHKCKLCDKSVLFSPKTMENHLRSDHQNSISWTSYKGILEEMSFTEDLSLLSTATCNLCGKEMVKGYFIASHFKYKHPNEKIQTTNKRTTMHRCKICNSILKFSIPALTFHMKAIHGISRDTYQKQYLYDSSQAGLEQKIFTDDLNLLSSIACNTCGKVMQSRGTVLKHFRLKHPGQTPQTTPIRTTWHRCKLCGTDLKFSINNCCAHLRSVHEGYSWTSYQCQYLKNSKLKISKFAHPGLPAQNLPDGGDPELAGVLNDGEMAAADGVKCEVKEDPEDLVDVKMEPVDEYDDLLKAVGPGGKVFTDDLNLLATVTCNICDKEMLKTDNVRRHFKQKHPGQKSTTTPKRTTWHKCKICTKVLQFSCITMANHLRRFHVTESWTSYQARFLQNSKISLSRNMSCYKTRDSGIPLNALLPKAQPDDDYKEEPLMYGDEEAHKLFSASMNVDDVPIKLEPLDDTEPADNGANKSEGVETKTKDNSVNEDVKEEEEEEIEEEEDEVELDVSEILNVSMNPSDDEQEEQEKVKEEENESGTEDMEEKEVKIENETEGSEDEDSGDRPGEEGEEVTQKEAEYRPWT